MSEHDIDEVDQQNTIEQHSIPGIEGGFSMVELDDNLPHVGDPTTAPPQLSFDSTPSFQYQQTPPTYVVGQYQQQYPVSQSSVGYGSHGMESGVVMNHQYYSYPVPPQQLDVSQGGYQYTGQAGYRNMQNATVQPQFATGVARPVQTHSQPQNFNAPRYQYSQSPQLYPQQVGRAMSFPTIYPTSPPSRTVQYVHQASPFQMYTPTFMQNPGEHHQSIGEDPAISSDPDNILPRGPPRKPKQSGFALWVGNLPRDVQLEELKEFFAMDTLESIFLIRKSNCAFVNYKTEEACSTALSMFNDKSTFFPGNSNFSVQECPFGVSATTIIS
jgi:hypothetical protein